MIKNPFQQKSPVIEVDIRKLIVAVTRKYLICFLAGLSPVLTDVVYDCSHSIGTQWVEVCGLTDVWTLCATQKYLTMPRYEVAFLGKSKCILISILTELSLSTRIREDEFSS
jgi:hypothetical protein